MVSPHVRSLTPDPILTNNGILPEIGLTGLGIAFHRSRRIVLMWRVGNARIRRVDGIAAPTPTLHGRQLHWKWVLPSQEIVPEHKYRSFAISTQLPIVLGQSLELTLSHLGHFGHWRIGISFCRIVLLLESVGT